MNMWMAGGPERTLYVTEAPYTTLLKGLTPNNVCVAPSSTSTLIVRQEEANAWTSPFVAVFEPVEGTEQVRGMKCLGADRKKVILNIPSINGREDYLFSATDSSASFLKTKNIRFQGSFGLVTERNGKVEQLYMVNACLFETSSIKMMSDTSVSASIYRKDGEWKYSSTAPITIVMGNRTYKLNSGYDLSIE